MTTWMGNALFDQISPYKIAFIYQICTYLSALFMSKTSLHTMHHVELFYRFCNKCNTTDATFGASFLFRVVMIAKISARSRYY